MKVRELLTHALNRLDAHRDACKGQYKVNCNVVEELSSLIRGNEVRVIPKRPTWTNGIGEKILIESLTDSHLNNIINMLDRLGKRDRPVYGHLIAEWRKRANAPRGLADHLLGFY